MVGGGGGVRDKRVPYKILMERINIEIELCWLLVELLFMILYFCVFIAYVIVDSQVTVGFEVNTYVKSRFAEQPFPNLYGHAIRFADISTPNDFLQWFDNVALPVVSKEMQMTTTNESVVPVFQAYLWQKRVRASSSACVNAPAFLWQQVNQVNNNPQQADSSSLPVCYPGYSDADEAHDELPNFNYSPSSTGGGIRTAPLRGRLAKSYSASGYFSPALGSDWQTTWWPEMESTVISSGTRLLAVQGIGFFPSYNYWTTFTLSVELSNSGQVTALAPEVLSGQLGPCSSLYVCGEDLVLLALGSLTAVFVILHLVLFLAFRVRAIKNVYFPSHPSTAAAAAWDKLTSTQRAMLALSQLVGFFVLADFAQVVLGMITLTYVSQTLWESRLSSGGDVPMTNFPLDLSYVNEITSALRLKNEMTLIFGLQVLLFNIQVFKYFPALPCFTLPRRAWEVACFDVFKVFVLYLVCILAFSFSGWLAFGSELANYETFELAMNSAVQAVLGEISFAAAAGPDGVDASVFLWFFYLYFIICFMYILQALFLSAVLDGFRVAFRENEGREFVAELAGKLLCCCRGGGGGGGSKNGKKNASASAAAAPASGINFSAMSKKEVSVRLRDWKARKANEEAKLISWMQLRDALRGFTYNRLDVSDEEVDAIFRLVDVVHMVQQSKRALNKPASASASAAEGGADGGAVDKDEDDDDDVEEVKKLKTAVEVVDTVLQIKADEREFVARVTASVREVGHLQHTTQVALKLATQTKLAATTNQSAAVAARA